MAAIYQWFKNFIIYTTTLYPVEVVDEMQLDAVIDGDALMRALPEDDTQISAIIAIDGSYTQLRWFHTYGPEEDDTQVSAIIVIDGTYTQLRWFHAYGPEEDDTQISAIIVINGTYESGRVWGDTPDEELQLDGVIDADCTMDAI